MKYILLCHGDEQGWNKLSETEKTAFKQAGKNSALLMRKLWNQRVAAARDIVTKNGT